MHASVVLVDYGCDLDPSVLWAVADAATFQTHRDLALPVPYGYGVAATVRVASSPGDVRPDEWVLAYLPGSGPPNVLGYHNRTSSGQPIMYVFPSLEDPVMRGLVETHEIIETLVDPWIDKVIADRFGRLVACEPADPVEASWYPVAVRGRWVPVSNFVTPAYYQPLLYPHVRYDFLGLLQYPGQLLPGGYLGVFTPGVGWSQAGNGRLRAYRAAVYGSGRSRRRSLGGSRR
jgi:hypothetical protein